MHTQKREKKTTVGLRGRTRCCQGHVSISVPCTTQRRRQIESIWSIHSVHSIVYLSKFSCLVKSYHRRLQMIRIKREVNFLFSFSLLDEEKLPWHDSIPWLHLKFGSSVLHSLIYFYSTRLYGENPKPEFGTSTSAGAMGGCGSGNISAT